jgi:hypothetical protein
VSLDYMSAKLRSLGVLGGTLAFMTMPRGLIFLQSYVVPSFVMCGGDSSLNSWLLTMTSCVVS